MGCGASSLRVTFAEPLDDSQRMGNNGDQDDGIATRRNSTARQTPVPIKSMAPSPSPPLSPPSIAPSPETNNSNIVAGDKSDAAIIPPPQDHGSPHQVHDDIPFLEFEDVDNEAFDDDLDVPDMMSKSRRG